MLQHIASTCYCVLGSGLADVVSHNYTLFCLFLPFVPILFHQLQLLLQSDGKDENYAKVWSLYYHLDIEFKVQI